MKQTTIGKFWKNTNTYWHWDRQIQ